MKILFMTDTHLGVRGGSAIFRQLFREYYRDVLFPYIKANNITDIFHLGDFFDSRTSISLADISYVMNEFIPLVEESGVTMRIIAGNHDTAFRNTNDINSLALFAHSESVRIIDNHVEVVETEGKNFVLIPWVNSGNEEQIFEEIKFYANKDHILCGHLDVIGSPMYKNSKLCDHGFEASMFRGFYKVLSGHFHEPSKNGNVEYLGALFHYNWQDHMCWRGFHVYDPETDTWTKQANEYELFTSLIFTDDTIEHLDTEGLDDCVRGQFVRVICNEVYDKVKLKQFIHEIELCSPIKVDVIDNTLTDDVTIDLDDEGQQTVSVKEIHEYVEEALAESPNKATLSKLFDEVYNQAKEQMKTIE